MIQKEKQINYEKIRKERRYKILYIEEEEILSLIVTGNENPFHFLRFRTLKLPEDYHIFNVYHSPERKAFGFSIGSETFPSVMLGAYPPNLEDEIKITTIKLIENKDFEVIK